MNFSVLLFFLHTMLATGLLGFLFIKKGGMAKFFGVGLVLDALAFASWALCLLLPANLAIFVTIGAVLFLISLLFFLRAGIGDTKARTLILGIGVLAVCGIFVAGRYIFPTPKFISEEGFLFFNLAPFVQMLYTFALALVAFPVIEKIALMFKKPYATFVRYALIVQVVGGIMLITSTDTLSLLVTGWIIGITYFALWTTLLFRKDIWSA